ncbi:MAG: arginine--tRNA ligase [Candidatus Paceibacterota bacterium]
MLTKEKIRNLLFKTFQQIKKENSYSFDFLKSDIGIISQQIKERGDYSSNFPFLIAKKANLDPQKIAQIFQEKIENQKINKKINFLEKIQNEKGFLNFYIKKEFVLKDFLNFLEKEKINIKRKKKGKVIIDFSSPNIAKPMHVGHLRSTLLGDALAKLFELFDYKVIRWNYLGDWGTQFGKLILAYKLWGDPEKLKKDPINYLLELYQRLHQELKANPSLEEKAQKEFALLEKGDPENKKLWQLFLKLSLKEFKKTYKLLKVKFDLFLGESFFAKKQNQLIEILKRKNLLKESEGALIVDLSEFNLPPALIFKKDEAGLYLTRDLTALFYRIKKYRPEKILYVVGNEQTLHFNQLFAIFKKIEKKLKTELIHVKFGLVLAPEGKKFSSREGEMILVDDLIKEAFLKCLKIIQEKNKNWPQEKQIKVAQKIALSLIKFNTLKTYRLNDVVFDWKKILDVKGKTSIYLQYTFARLNKILRKAKKEKISFLEKKKLFFEKEKEWEIIKKILDFQDSLEASLNLYSLHPLANYLLSLADLMNQYYETIPILKEENENKKLSRLFLVKKVINIFEISFSLLGIEPLKEI